MALGAAQISLRAIRTEFVGPAGQVSLRAFRRGGSYVRNKAGDNPATNMAASVSATTQVSMRSFRSAIRLFRYTNSATINNSSMQAWFGSDWDVDYPKEFVNNGSCNATNTSNWGFRVDGGAGTRTLTNNSYILGAGGASQQAAGGHGLYLNSTGLRLYNNYAIYSGGGGGGYGGYGGTGGTGYYDTAGTGQEGPTYSFGGGSPGYFFHNQSSGSYTQIYWAGPLATVNPAGLTSYASGGYTYYRSTYVTGSAGNEYYYIYRQWPTSTRSYTSGGGGGAGGAGGRGQGADGANQGGAGGAAGAGGGTNAGSGGYGGTGGTGGGWGAYGNTGNTGAYGNSGNYAGGTAGTAGAAGGAPGYYIYAPALYYLYTNAYPAGLYYQGF